MGRTIFYMYQTSGACAGMCKCNCMHQMEKTVILPLFYKNRFITHFKEKKQLFNIFFSKQCSLIPNNSSLPADVNYITDKRLSTVTFSARDIGKIIQNLDSNKAHGHDDLSSRMLQICGDSICAPLEMIFKQALFTGVFPSEWKKANIVPIHKRGKKQNIKYYRPVALLLICGKTFERLFLAEFLSISLLINSSLKTSLVSNPVIPVSTNCYQLPTKFLHLLIMD